MLIYLIRHAESAPDPRIPESDWPLSEEGFRQAQQLSERFLGIHLDRIISSPYIRALDTVKPIAASKNLQLEVHEDLRERKLSPGLIDNWLEELERTWKDFDYKLVGGESSAECQQRVFALVQDLADEGSHSTIALSSHGNAIALFLNKALGNFDFNNWKQMKNPDVFELQYKSNQYQLTNRL